MLPRPHLPLAAHEDVAAETRPTSLILSSRQGVDDPSRHQCVLLLSNATNGTGAFTFTLAR